MVQGKCACCDTRLKYPSNVHCYRCTVCTAVTDLSPITPKRIPKPLNLDRLSEIKERWEMEEDAGREILEKEVSRVFASFEALTASFSTGNEPSTTDPQIAYDTLSRAISIITSLDSPPLVDNILKSLELLLRRPGRPMTSPSALRLIPLILRSTLLSSPSAPRKRSILSRLVGWVSGAGNHGHHIIVTWLSQWSRQDLLHVVEGVGALIAYRLSKAEKTTRDVGIGMGTRGLKNLVTVLDNGYTTDWRTKAAAKMMALLHAASNMSMSTSSSSPPLPVSEFYCTMIDYIDLISDFRDWERGGEGGQFAFCQYPLLISLGSKITILEYDARRQMEVKAREAFFETLTTKKVVRPYLLLRIRRAHLMEDSMRQLRAVGVEEGGELKKGLRIQFEGEDGVDAGGLRKEWFLILVREIFDPKYGLFVEEESSGVVWFDPGSTSKEALEKYYLAGVVVGLAIYNSTILDVRLPRALFTKLMHPSGKLGLEDMEGWKPEFVKGLRQLLEFEGDVETVLGLDFTVHDIHDGSLHDLVPNGSRRPVTNANRKEYVDAYVAYLLNTSVNAQYSAFRDGFWRVCGGNAMGLFSAEEVEGLVCGLGMGEERVDVEAIRAVAVYEGYHRRGGAGAGASSPPVTINPESDPLITWFWSFFSSLPGADQRRLLRFITGSDRVPATGAANLAFKISVMPEVNGGDDRFPVAHTCFNQIVLPRYKRREKMEGMLRRAMWESEGFGLR
ncbi:Putative E3 ubiquitin-protein ligase [Saitoella coloradoensis]